MAYWTPKNVNPLQNEAPRVAVGAVGHGRAWGPHGTAERTCTDIHGTGHGHGTLPHPTAALRRRNRQHQPLSLPPLPLLPLLPLLVVPLLLPLLLVAASHSSLEEEEVVGQTRSTPRSDEYCSLLRGARPQFFRAHRPAAGG